MQAPADHSPNHSMEPVARDSVLLVSCYELGQEPLGLTVPAGVLARAGLRARLLDLAVAPIDLDAIARADVIAISTPMHTALRLGTHVATIARRVNPDAHVCFFGLYAELNRDHLLPALADSVLGAEFETSLVSLVRRVAAARTNGIRPRDMAPEAWRHAGARSPVRTLDLTPHRDGLSHRDRYVKLALGDERHDVAHVAASRGCKHVCRHCPLPPVYGGAFYALPIDRVMDDIAALVLRGARHVTFSDPDFLNGPTHALRVARELSRRFAGLTFDYTAKVEHLLRHHDAVGELQALGNLFVVSAVESFNDAVLATLHKGHTRSDALAVIRRFRERALTLRPTFVPFTPWETRASYAELLDVIDGEGLVEHVDAVQYSIRLLVPEGSLLLDAEEMRPHLGAFDPETFSYRWMHPDATVDALQRDVARIVADAAIRGADAFDAFARVRAVVAPGASLAPRTRSAGPVPRLTEDWFC